jgi:hypothetical protein
MSFSFSNNFARILAKENIVIRRSLRASTASFNMKTRVLILPIWENISEALHDMVLVHEVGHALDTPLDPLVKAIKKMELDYKIAYVKDYLNVVEDARIDRAQKVRYPGTLSDYALGYRELHNRDFFGISKVDNVNTLPFIDRINLYFKNGHHLGLKFSPAEQVLIDRVATTVTFDDAVDVTDAILKYVRLTESIPEKKTALDEEFSEAYGEGDDEEGSEGSEGSEGAEKGSGETTENEYKTLKDALEKAQKGNKGKLVNSAIPEADTYRNMTSALDKSRSKGSDEPTIVNVGMADYISVLVPFKKLLKNTAISPVFAKWRDIEKPNVSYMVSEFERKKAADINKRVRVDKTGVLNMTEIHQYKYSDDIFKRQDIIPEGKNHGLLFLLDWSGSMGPIIHETMKQLLTLTMFCRMTNIPFDVYTFQSDGSRFTMDKNHSGILLDDTAAKMSFAGFALKNILSSRMTANEYLRMSSFFFELTKRGGLNSGEWNLGSTPLIAALEVFPDIVNDFIKLHKVQVPSVFVLTDGDSDMPSFGMSSSYGSGTVTINNPKTKKSYSTNRGSRDFLGAMIENLKDATNSRVVGIHLLERDRDCSVRYGMAFGTNGFGVTKERGYDKHYAVKTSNMIMTDRNKFWNRFDNNLSGDELSDVISEYGKSKNATRFLLRSFIDDISLDRTK